MGHILIILGAESQDSSLKFNYIQCSVWNPIDMGISIPITTIIPSSNSFPMISLYRAEQFYDNITRWQPWRSCKNSCKRCKSPWSLGHDTMNWDIWHGTPGDSDDSDFSDWCERYIGRTAPRNGDDPELTSSENVGWATAFCGNFMGQWLLINQSSIVNCKDRWVSYFFRHTPHIKFDPRQMRHAPLIGNPMESLEKTNESRQFTVSVSCDNHL